MGDWLIALLLGIVEGLPEIGSRQRQFEVAVAGHDRELERLGRDREAVPAETDDVRAVLEQVPAVPQRACSGTIMYMRT